MLTLLILAVLSTVCLGEDVFCGRNTELPDAGRLEQAWAAFVADGSLGKASDILDTIDHEANRGASLYMALETVNNFRNRFNDAMNYAIEGLRSARTSPWAEIFLYDITNISGFVRDIQPVLGVLNEISGDPAVSWFLRDYARFKLAGLTAEAGKPSESRKLYDTFDFIRKGVFCGPFPNRDGAGYSEQYPPETAFDPDDSYQGINRNVGWFSYETPRADGFLDFSAFFYPYENSVGYGLFSVYIPEEGEYIIHAGTGNSLKIWLNYEQVFSSDDKNGLFFDRYVFKTSFLKGWNLIFVKLGTTHDDDEWGLFLRVTGTDGNRISGFRNDFTDESKIGSGVFSGRVKETVLMKTPAEEFFHGMVEQSSDNSVAYGTLGFVYGQRSKGDREKMEDLRLYRKAYERAPKCPLWAELAGAVDKDVNKTLQVLQDIVDRNPDAFSLKEKIGSILYSEGFYRKFDSMTEQYFEESDEGSMPYLLYLRGRLFTGRNWTAEGLDLIRKAVGIYPRYKILLKTAASRAVNKQEELSYLMKVLELDATDIWALDRLAETAWEKGDSKTALKYIEQIINLHPSYYSAYLDLVRYYRDSGSIQKAQEVLRNALKIFPQSPSLRGLLGKLMVLDGKTDEGRQFMEEALEIDPNMVSLKEYTEFLSPEKHEFYEEWDFTREDAVAKYAGDDAYPKFNTVDIQDLEVVSVKKNGTEERMVHRLRKVLTDAGKDSLQYLRIPFSSSRSRVDIKYARIIKPDGRVVETDKIGTRSGLSTSSQGATMYSSYQYKIVVFPGLEKGDMIDYQYVKRDTQPDLFSDEFSDVSYLTGSAPAERSRYVVIAPRELKLNVGTFQTEIKPQLIPDKDGGYVYDWDLQKWPGIVRERSMRPLTEYLPYVIVSSMDSWDELGKWYFHLSKKQMHLTDEMKKTTAELVKDCKTDTEKARAVFRYVADEIRYVGIELGRNSYKPHRAESTFTTKYGDCKDTAVLMKALLSEAGIESDVVLVRTRQLGRIDKTVPSPYMFNHAICHIPDLDGKSVWLDGTTDFNRLEEVPWMDRTALVLIIKEKGSRIAVIPDEGVKSGIRIESSITLKDDGSAVLSVTNRFFGDQAPSYRRMFNSPDWFKQRVEQYYSRKFPGIDIKKVSMPKSDSIEVIPWYTVEAEVKRYALQQGDQLLLPSTVNPLKLSGSLLEKDRVYSYWLHSRMSIEETSRIVVPADYTVKFYPEPRKRESANGTFSQEVSVAGDTVTYTSSLVITDPTVTPGNYPEYKEFCGFTDSAQEERIVLEKKN